MFKNIFFVLALFAGSFNLNATNTLGGDITWDCLGNGKYQFKVSVFYFCDSASANPLDSVVIQTTANVAPIVCMKTDSVNVSPNCGGASGISCGLDSVYRGLIRIEYTSAEIVLQGVPSVNGWIFYTDLCCRGALINSVSDTSMTLRSWMYAPQGVNSATPCYDSSPDFLDIPHIYFANFTQQNLALADLSDTDADSVSIEWSRPWDGFTPGQAPVLMSFDTAYSYDSPLPGVTVDPGNVKGILNKASGNYQFYQVTTGKFAMSLKLTSYRQGQKIAEVNRDLPMIILPNVPETGTCANANNIPDISAISLNQKSLSAGLNSVGDTAYYKLQVQPGDTVSIKVSAFDSDLKPNCLPQEITFTGTGAALSLDSLYQDSSLSAISGLAATINPFGVQNGFVTTVNNQVQLNWIIEKVHAPYPGKTLYQFNFRFMDNNCNIPGTAEMAIRIEVNRPIELTPDTVAICNGDSALVDVAGDLTNLSWSPQTGVNNGVAGVFYLNPSQSTYYTLTDLNTGYSENVFIEVDNITTPVISVGSSQLELMSPGNYDQIFWTLNQAPIFAPAPNSTITPALSGTYRTVNSNGVCVATSNALDTAIENNFSLNPDVSGTYKGMDVSDVTYAMNIGYNGASPLLVDHITIAANHFTPNVKLKLSIYDVNTQKIFSTDSVVATQSHQLKAYGKFTLQPQELYLLTLYLGDSTNFHLFKAVNWPVVSENGLISVFNAARADGEVLLPSTTSENYPYIHFNFDGFIAIDENTLQTSYTVYPNPVNSILYLSQIDSYEIFNISGLMVLKVNESSKVFVGSLAKGVYIIKNSQGTVVKFVKQ